MNAGVYIHIPFCRSRCSYCAFATGIYQSALAEHYVSCVVKEINAWYEVAAPPPVDTVYFGGGTPSLLSPAQVRTILNAVNSRFRIAADAEVTLEINPGSTNGAYTRPNDDSTAAGLEAESSPSVLSEFRELGINRASF